MADGGAPARPEGCGAIFLSILYRLLSMSMWTETFTSWKLRTFEPWAAMDFLVGAKAYRLYPQRLDSKMREKLIERLAQLGETRTPITVKIMEQDVIPSIDGRIVRIVAGDKVVFSS